MHSLRTRFILFFGLFILFSSIIMGIFSAVSIINTGVALCEEQGIPIDYITGTSMGAIVGGLYAAGYSPDEIVKIFASDSFRNYYKGSIPPKYIDFFKYEQPDASLFRVDLRRKSKKVALALPTNIIAPQPMDLGLIDLFARSSAGAGNDLTVFLCLSGAWRQMCITTTKRYLTKETLVLPSVLP